MINVDYNDLMKVIYAYGNYRCDLGRADLKDNPSILIFLKSADELEKAQRDAEFYIIEPHTIEALKEWALNGPID